MYFKNKILFVFLSQARESLCKKNLLKSLHMIDIPRNIIIEELN